jgi:hypothetical protein
MSPCTSATAFAKAVCSIIERIIVVAPRGTASFRQCRYLISERRQPAVRCSTVVRACLPALPASCAAPCECARSWLLAMQTSFMDRAARFGMMAVSSAHRLAPHPPELNCSGAIDAIAGVADAFNALNTRQDRFDPKACCAASAANHQSQVCMPLSNGCPARSFAERLGTKPLRGHAMASVGSFQHNVRSASGA